MDIVKLRLLLDCDVETGQITRKVDSNTRWKAGRPAGHYRSDGRIYVRVGGIKCMAHRLVWFFAHGELPEFEIDHINGNPADNRISNLRLATHAQNVQNIRRARRHNKTGLLGVSWNPNVNRYRADIAVNKRRRFLGHFDEPEAAHAAYLTAKATRHPFQTLVAYA